MLGKWFNGLNKAQINFIRIVCYVLCIGLVVSNLNWDSGGNAILLSLGMWLLVVLIYLDLRRKRRNDERRK